MTIQASCYNGDMRRERPGRPTCFASPSLESPFRLCSLILKQRDYSGGQTDEKGRVLQCRRDALRRGTVGRILRTPQRLNHIND